MVIKTFLSTKSVLAAVLFVGCFMPCLGQWAVQSNIQPQPSVVRVEKSIGGTGLLHAVRKAHIQSLQKQHVHLPDTTSWYAKLPHFKGMPLLGVYEHYILRNLPQKETLPIKVFLNNLDTKTVLDDTIEKYFELIKRVTAKKERTDISPKEKDILERELRSYNNLLTRSLERRLADLQDKKWNETIEQKQKRLQQLSQEFAHQIDMYQKNKGNEFALERLKALRDLYKQQQEQ